ncbi:MAG: alkaline phosphatase [Gammaproteobacteria bacterium]|nr:alkaline phosphatase [Gammaproteobacteria bacterium]
MNVVAVMLISCAKTPSLAMPKATSPQAALPQTADPWFGQGMTALETALQRPTPGTRARNVIVFIGDGMDISTITAARILAGQQRGASGEENALSFETFPYTGLAKTYNTNQQTPDSAGTATAMLAGVKTKAGVIGLTDRASRGRCATAAASEAMSIVDLAEEAGLATGIVTTTRITHATPAAAYAKTPDRGWEADSKIPAAERSCEDIASQLVNYPHGDGIDVLFGGGRRYFLPADVADPEHADEKGRRLDGKNLVTEWLAAGTTRRRFVWNRAQFDALEPASQSQVLGLFEYSHMRYEADRRADTAGEPSLRDMTEKAIRMLATNERGYFLLVEGGRIDHGHHDGNAYRALTDTIAFAEAVGTASEMTDNQDTLIVVTADHGHTMRIVGYPTRGNPILGLVVENDRQGGPMRAPTLDINGLPYTTIAYANGPGFHGASDEQPAGPKRWPHDPQTVQPLIGGRANLARVDTADPDYLQEAGIPTFSTSTDGDRDLVETHSAGDVTIYATGPGAHLLSGVHEQNYIFHVMRYAQGL